MPIRQRERERERERERVVCVCVCVPLPAAAPASEPVCDSLSCLCWLEQSPDAVHAVRGMKSCTGVAGSKREGGVSSYSIGIWMEWADRQLDGQMDSLTDGQTDGWMQSTGV